MGFDGEFLGADVTENENHDESARSVRLVVWTLHQTQRTSSPRETAAAIRLAVRVASAQHSNGPL
jgi:hypothetical protein